MYLSQSFKIGQSHNSDFWSRIFLCLAFLEADVPCQIQQPMRGEAAVSLCLQVQPAARLKMYYQHVHAEWMLMWYKYIYYLIHIKTSVHCLPHNSQADAQSTYLAKCKEADFIWNSRSSFWGLQYKQYIDILATSLIKDHGYDSGIGAFVIWGKSESSKCSAWKKMNVQKDFINVHKYLAVCVRNVLLWLLSYINDSMLMWF